MTARSLLARVAVLLDNVKFAHTIFALPFALMAMFLANVAQPPSAVSSESHPGAGVLHSPLTPPAVAELLRDAPAVWPRHVFRPAGPVQAALQAALTAAQARQVRQFNAAERDQWVRHYGLGRLLPSIPIRPAWADQLQLQTLGPRLIVASYGYRLIVFDPSDGWMGPLGISAEDFVIAGEGGPPI
jgi:hypothetical protein